MRHYTCDGCGSDLTDPVRARYALTITAQNAHDVNETDDIPEGTIKEETAALIRALEDGLAANEELTTLPARAMVEYDLCPQCFGEYLRDPIGRSRKRDFAFSTN